ncbi:MAG: exosome complex RNA-binding protein Csl4 [Candidatus Bathyarchaeota archaeon]|nr:exosome complex RNA-binding protein Csl4 [Candidatus Bathyarchaeota archaeon]
MTLKPEERSGALVIPGERLGVIEEFIPDSGTYVRDGVIYSKIIGRALMDMLNRRVSVYPLTEGAVVPKIGATVVGQVGNAQSDNVLVRIFQVGNKTKMSGVFGGILHISDVSDRYIDSMSEVCKSGDIIRAKVISEKNQIFHLSTSDNNLGVLHAFCSLCGNLLEQRRHEMYCTKCGNVERRKTTFDYGKDEVLSGA